MKILFFLLPPLIFHLGRKGLKLCVYSLVAIFVLITAFIVTLHFFDMTYISMCFFC